jgi:transcriptional regulator with XRE-family HTH domain
VSGAWAPIERAEGAAALGTFLRRLRERYGISQEAIARHIGMSYNAYGCVERGLSPRPGMLTVARIARGTCVSVRPLVSTYLGAKPVELPDTPSADALPFPPVARGSERPDVMGACVAALRERAGLSQTRLAAVVGVQRTQVGSVETGGRANVAVTTIARFVRGIAPDADLALVVGVLAQVFAGEVGPEEFERQAESFIRIGGPTVIWQGQGRRSGQPRRRKATRWDSK